MVALGLSQCQIPIQPKPVGWDTNVMNVLPPDAQHSLGLLAHERVKLARSAFYQGALVYLCDTDVRARCRVPR